MLSENLRDAKIMVVDDDIAQTALVRDILRLDGYQDIRMVNDSRGALAIFIEYQPDIVLLDLMMPYVSGFQILDSISSYSSEPVYLPILIVSAEPSLEARRYALSGGAVDYLVKPFVAEEMRLRIANLLRIRRQQLHLREENRALAAEVLHRTRELEGYQLELQEAQIEIVARLARAAERRDDETGQHTQRVALTASLIAQTIGLSDHEVSLIRNSSPLHDVGKIGVPDSVLLKPGLFTRAERAIMQAHCRIGGELLAGGHSDIVRVAESIACAHHEKWDGSGYPEGLRGEEIPVASRIVAIADVFDALTHRRPYKEAWPLQDAIAEIESQSGLHFEPRIVDAFLTLPHKDLL